MSRIVAPGVGEIVDRLQILALKVLYAKERGKPWAHFERELTTLTASLSGRTVTVIPAFLLGAVHAALWHKTDELREFQRLLDQGEVKSKICDLWEAARLGLQIMQLNDARAVYVRQINELAGEAEEGAEKL